MKNQLFAVTLTLVSILIIAAATVSGLAALPAAPFLVYLIGAAVLRGGSPQLEVTRTLDRTRVVPREPVTVTVTIRNHGAAVRELIAIDQVPHGLSVIQGKPRVQATLEKDAELTWSYTVAGNRGSYLFTGVKVTASGDLPLWSDTLFLEASDELVTLPGQRELSRIPIAPRRTLVYSGTLPARRGGEGTEFFDVAEHRDEALRHVNWRVSARQADRLFVNKFQEERVADVAILLDLRSRAYPLKGWLPLFDAAASAAASLADVLLDTGNRVGYLGYGLSLDWLSPGFGKHQKHLLLSRIARSMPGDSHVFHRFDEIPYRLFPAGSQVIVVSPLMGDDFRALEQLQQIGYAVLVISPDAVGYERKIADPQPSEGAWRLARAERLAILQRLRRSSVAVIDWDTDTPLETAVSRSIGAIQATWRRSFHRRLR